MASVLCAEPMPACTHHYVYIQCAFARKYSEAASHDLPSVEPPHLDIGCVNLPSVNRKLQTQHFKMFAASSRVTPRGG